nr:uncharacterized protein LOC113813008 [Penaeus vannamei]
MCANPNQRRQFPTRCKALASTSSSSSWIKQTADLETNKSAGGRPVALASARNPRTKISSLFGNFSLRTRSRPYVPFALRRTGCLEEAEQRLIRALMRSWGSGVQLPVLGTRNAVPRPASPAGSRLCLRRRQDLALLLRRRSPRGSPRGSPRRPSWRASRSSWLIQQRLPFASMTNKTFLKIWFVFSI